MYTYKCIISRNRLFAYLYTINRLHVSHLHIYIQMYTLHIYTLAAFAGQQKDRPTPFPA